MAQQSQLSPVLPYDGSAAAQEASAAAANPVKQQQKAPSAGADGRPLPIAWDSRSDAAAYAKTETEAEPRPRRAERLEAASLLVLAVLDNALAYMTFFYVQDFNGRLYNLVDLNIVLLPGIEICLLIFAMLGTCSFLMIIVLVECCKLPLYHELMNFRLLCSAVPCGVISAILVFYTERHLWVPFASMVAVLFMVFVWCLHMRVHYSKSLNIASRIALDISWLFALIFLVFVSALYLTDSLDFITNSDSLSCPVVKNQAMPVHVIALGTWYCAKFGDDERLEIQRTTVNSAAQMVSCNDTFVSAFGVSIEAHQFQCPSGCLATYVTGQDIFGCNVYALDSPICLAAVHAGALTDQGGVSTVYGRLGVPTFQRCSINSITSVERVVAQVDSLVGISSPPGGGSSLFTLPTTTAPPWGSRRLSSSVTAPVVHTSSGTLPQAFHFNNHPDTKEFMWLQKYNKLSAKDTAVKAGKPWSKIEATVSLRLAGIELDSERLGLGEQPPQPLFSSPSQAVTSASAPDCRLRATGVLCRGAGAAVVHLDFCRPDVKTCLGS